MKSTRTLAPFCGLSLSVLTAFLLASCSSGSSKPQVKSARFDGKQVNLSGYSDAQIPPLLDEYARQLNAAGKTSDATRVEEQANAMRRAATEMSHGAWSVYLGFRPDETLRQYAAFLKSSGDTVKAAQIETVADQYHAMQMWNFVQQQQMRGSQAQQ